MVWLERLGWVRTIALSVGGAVGTLIASQISDNDVVHVIGSILGTMGAAAAIHFLRQAGII